MAVLANGMGAGLWMSLPGSFSSEQGFLFLRVDESDEPEGSKVRVLQNPCLRPWFCQRDGLFAM